MNVRTRKMGLGNAVFKRGTVWDGVARTCEVEFRVLEYSTRIFNACPEATPVEIQVMHRDHSVSRFLQEQPWHLVGTPNSRTGTVTVECGSAKRSLGFKTVVRIGDT